MKTIIMINGAARSGKDYTASLITKIIEEKEQEIRTLSFAYPIKKIIADTFDITLETLDKYKNDRLRIIAEDSSGYQEDISDFRILLQRFGTQSMKPQFGEAVWSNLLLSKILDDGKPGIILVPDFRFNIESDIIKSSNYRIITLKVENDDITSTDSHASERELDDYDFDYHIDNTGYCKHLEQKVQEFIDKHDLIY